ncbi:hypothetical protein [Brevundimonas sp. Root1279]|uniref:hypothetical protein n=1 Tax=Brevundimonas sp. Root1279 TaxID=1736443 RepID=UPI0006F815D6|nr:hypothetical protein [Brevundimonas sp. Root1279]KQW84078.1 hypothetical protein ASC65_05570 [Brevundimonas sp. Root1279]
MDFLKILRSIEELLYEAVSWLYFYPRTLFLTVLQPLKTMHYSDQEQRDREERRYLDTLSPPLFLVLSILIAHGLELATGLGVEAMRSNVGRMIAEDDQRLLMFRALMFSVHPLAFAWVWLHLQKRRADRDSLRSPFFAQCYLSGTTSILVSLGTLGVRDPRLSTTLAGVVIVAAATLWYLVVQLRWLRQVEGVGPWRATAWAVGTFLGSTGLVLLSSAVLD